MTWSRSTSRKTGVTRYGYDAAGRLRSESLLNRAGVLTSTLNAAGLATALSVVMTDTAPAATTRGTTAFTYTAADKPQTVTFNSGGGACRRDARPQPDRRRPRASSGDAETDSYDTQGHTRDTTATLANIGTLTADLPTYTAQGFCRQTRTTIRST